MNAAKDIARAPTSVVVVPAEKFFTRIVPLSPSEEVAAQVMLAVESLAPLPLGQLYYGYRVADDLRRALVWVGCRRHFSADETATWSDAGAVLPGMFALCQPPHERPAIIIHTDGMRLQAVAWGTDGSLPLCILTRAISAAEPAVVEQALVREIARRTRRQHLPVRRLEGTFMVRVEAQNEKLICELKGPAGETTPLAVFSRVEALAADIRDKVELAAFRQRTRKNRWLWRATLATAAVLLAAAMLEAGNGVAAQWLKRREARLAGQAAEVDAVQSAQALGNRLEELAQQQLKFLDMLDLLNVKRPPGVEFVRVTNRGLHGVEINAQAASGDEVQQYGAQLRALPELAAVQVRDLQTRDGRISFVLEAGFRPEALMREGLQ